MRSPMCCCVDDDVGASEVEIQNWRDDRKEGLEMEENHPLLDPRTASTEASTPPPWCSCSRVCGWCCCLLLLGVVGAGVYAGLCIKQTMEQDSIVLPLAESKGVRYFTLSNMSVPRDRWEDLSLDLDEPWNTTGGYTFGYAPAETAPLMLFEGSKAVGVFENIPEKLRGVWWMRGNPIAEVLATLQFSQWYEEEKTLLMPNSPWTWAWWGGEATDYPEGLDELSKVVYRFASGRSLAESYTEATAIDTVVSFVFEPCPGGAECEAGAEGLAYAKLMSHSNGNLTEHGMVYYDGYTMEEMPGSEVANESQREGSLYFRRSELFCGLFGRGSGYNLTKIVDGYGNKVEPHFSDYLAFMAGRPLIIWSGLPP